MSCAHQRFFNEALSSRMHENMIIYFASTIFFIEWFQVNCFRRQKRSQSQSMNAFVSWTQYHHDFSAETLDQQQKNPNIILIMYFFYHFGRWWHSINNTIQPINVIYQISYLVIGNWFSFLFAAQTSNTCIYKLYIKLRMRNIYLKFDTLLKN